MFDFFDGDDTDKMVRKKAAEQGLDSVDWNLISEAFRLSETFMREFKDYLNWGYIQRYGWQYLSENFIREFRDKFPNLVLYEEQLPENRKDLENIRSKNDRTRLRLLW